MKIKRFDISTEFLKSILQHGMMNIATIKNPLPEDAELVRIFTNPYESSLRTISLFYKSESFPEQIEGTLLNSEKIEFTITN